MQDTPCKTNVRAYEQMLKYSRLVYRTRFSVAYIQSRRLLMNRLAFRLHLIVTLRQVLTLHAVPFCF